jgi:HlyD family secretion protein
MTMNKKIRILILALLVLVGLVLWKVSATGPFRYAGTVEATEVDLSSRVASVVSQYSAKEGDAVTLGQPLVTLACEDLKLSRDSAQSDFERAERLYKSGAMPFETFDHLRVKRDDAAMRAGWCSVKAPLNATILDTYHEAGEWVTPGVKLLTLADLAEVWAVFYVPQTSLAKVSLGMEVAGTLPELANRKFTGKVTHISSEAEFTPKNVQTRKERTRLVYGVKVTFSNADGVLKPGMTLEAQLPD